jgi:hypothetical protein
MPAWPPASRLTPDWSAVALVRPGLVMCAPTDYREDLGQ